MFLWPWLLTALLLIPLAVWLYRKGLKPAAKQTLAHPDLALLAEAGSSGKRYWKHLPSVFYFAAGLFTLVALARPTMLIPEANPLTGIILAIDTSRSMRTADIAPNRFEAARQAVRDFIDGLPEGAR